jgi:hypothetical protein
MTGPGLVLSTAAVFEPHGVQLPARWSYDPAQPYAICLSVRCGCGGHGCTIWHDWRFARDLLAAGLFAATGMGDVRVEPYPGDGLLVTLDSPSGHAVLRLDARHAERALLGSYELVPDGSEDRLLDWDTGLIELCIEEQP